MKNRVFHLPRFAPLPSNGRGLRFSVRSNCLSMMRGFLTIEILHAPYRHCFAVRTLWGSILVEADRLWASTPQN